MPDLGKYAAEVLSAYGVSLALIVAIVVLSIRSATRAKRKLSEVTAKSERVNG